ncbi:uncharacterized protein LOC127786945 [Diospyros lotus]|uniref:uncharacterized protein LOC127786945 n=1 Tax=Diospyros lotus TaxID=55363 RepID=UPI002253AB83|nr:uncharacterized protein LOC127786945 [Diospyros lotus]
MTSNQHRRIGTPPRGGPSNNKRKERESLQIPPPPNKKLVRPNDPRPKPGPVQSSAKSPEPASNNQLLAGYLAHEFLTKGTLFGQPWGSTRAEAVESRRPKQPGSSQEAEAEARIEEYQRYVEVASLLKTDGAHLPGIVNPTQLARFLQL